jgi:hypothetical protein
MFSNIIIGGQILIHTIRYSNTVYFMIYLTCLTVAHSNLLEKPTCVNTSYQNFQKICKAKKIY